MAGFRSLWGTLPAPSNAESGLVWIELKQRQPLLDVCPDSSTPVHLSNGRRMCSTRNASSCLAYSFGSNGDFEFEEEVLRQDPRCEIHTFDPTMEVGERRAAIQTSIKRASARLQASIRVHRGFGLAHFDGMGDIPHPRKEKATIFRMATLPTIMQELGHSHVRGTRGFICPQCDGCLASFLRPGLDGNSPLPPNHLRGAAALLLRCRRCRRRLGHHACSRVRSDVVGAAWLCTDLQTEDVLRRGGLDKASGRGLRSSSCAAFWLWPSQGRGN